jgi:hypothetical protein
MSKRKNKFEILETLYSERTANRPDTGVTKFSITISNHDLALYDALAKVLGTSRARIITAILSESTTDALLDLEEQDMFDVLSLAHKEVVEKQTAEYDPSEGLSPSSLSYSRWGSFLEQWKLSNEEGEK